MKNKILLLISVVMLGVAFWISRPDGKTRIIFCDVGQGDGMIVMSGTAQMVIDTGPDNKKMVKCLGRYLPFWDKKIEVMVLTHGDSDHSGGAESVKKSYRVENLYDSLRYKDIVRVAGIEYRVLSPEEISGEGNVDSIVGIINEKVLLMGDATMEVEQRLVWRGIISNSIEVLKVSHHGSKEATSRELLGVIKPKLAVISVGKNNKFGHPSPEVMERLGGVETKRTDVDGDIVVNLGG